MKRSREQRFKKSVEELHQRLGRAENYIDTQLVEDKSMETKSSKSDPSTEVYRDKNTLVEVTIHRRPKDKEPKAPDDHFARPTSSSLTRSKQSPRKVKKSEKIPSKFVSDKENEKGRGRREKDKRSVQELLGELRDIVKVSGVKDVHDFLEEFEATDKPERSAKLKQRGKFPTKLCQKSDHSDLEANIYKLEVECKKYKAEAGRYKHEYGVVVKQVEISRDTVLSLEAQVVDLKKIISRLTRNNGELLEIVSEKIEYEDLIADLKKKSASLTDQLNQEKSHSSKLEERLHSAEAEATGLRSLSADLRAGLRHGLAGLELPRPNSRPSLPPLGDDTRNILGMKGEGHSDTDDSAYDDPNTESLTSKYAGKVRPGTELTEQVIGRVNTNVGPNLSFTPPTKMATSKFTQHPKHPPPHKRNNLQQAFPSQANFIPPTQVPIAANPSPQNSPSINLFPDPTRAQSRSSTLMENPVASTSPTFHPLPLDMSETVSQLDGIEKQSFSKVPTSPSSTPPTIIQHLAGPPPPAFNPPATKKASKLSLEAKVSDFLARLQQDSLHLSLDIPQAQSFQGASMHLSLSSSDMEQDMTRDTINTTLTEGKFLRGLETSIEVLQAELSKNSE